MASTTKSSTSSPKKSKSAPPKVEPVVPPSPSKEVAPVVAPAVAVVPDNGVVPLVPEVSLTDVFVNMNKMVHDLSTSVALLKAELKTVEKQVTKELKVLDKLNARKNKKKGNRAPSGFVKPTKITNELADFLGREHGSLMARTEVTKQMTEYIRTHSLQDKKNGRVILPDAKLRKLLKLTDKDALTYFNLQKYMSPHFEKAPVVA
jgi:chromatin remodeling complex protein RSC6